MGLLMMCLLFETFCRNRPPKCITALSNEAADQAALDIRAPYLAHIVKVSDAEVAQAVHSLYTDTHNVAEAAGAASFAAAMQERHTLQGRVVGTTLNGGNEDATALACVVHDR